MLKFNFYLRLESKPKLEDWNQNPFCGWHCAIAMNKRARSLQLMQNMNIKCSCKI